MEHVILYNNLEAFFISDRVKCILVVVNRVYKGGRLNRKTCQQHNEGYLFLEQNPQTTKPTRYVLVASDFNIHQKGTDDGFEEYSYISDL